MVVEGSGSTVPRRTLGIGLRAAREKAGVKLKDAAALLGVSEQTIWRIEQGTTSTKPPYVQALCDAYGVHDGMREVFVGLARETRSRGWWHAYGDVLPTWFEAYVGLEQAAQRIRIFDPAMIPGLLQHREYTGAFIRVERPGWSEGDIEKTIELKQSRQQLLTRSFPAPPSVDVIIGETVLMAEPKPEGIMRRQVWHLLKATELPNVSIRVLDRRVGPHRASLAGAFRLLSFPEQNGSAPPPTVYSENLTGALYLDKTSEIAEYAGAWEAISDAALPKHDTIELLKECLKELNDRER
ncbi:helix-turn-helix transcriptional regulator [Actinoplanes sp. NPDC051475]|uniref:helix-turn-helix domain-containing protein n=1 Tax=Actinoplanes sp. NPDC051475 TaxID=3157225 RepID=UPI00344C8E97